MTDDTASQCSTSSAGHVYPINPSVYVDTPSHDPLDIANIEPSILNVTACAEYMSLDDGLMLHPHETSRGFLTFWLREQSRQINLHFLCAL